MAGNITTPCRCNLCGMIFSKRGQQFGILFSAVSSAGHHFTKTKNRHTLQPINSSSWVYFKKNLKENEVECNLASEASISLVNNSFAQWFESKAPRRGTGLSTDQHDGWATLTTALLSKLTVKTMCYCPTQRRHERKTEENMRWYCGGAARLVDGVKKKKKGL